MLYDSIDRPNLEVCSNYLFWNPCHFRLLVHSKTRYYCLHEFLIWECIQYNMAFMLYAWIVRPSLGVCSNYLFQNLSHLRLIFLIEIGCYCLHEFFVWECIQNYKTFIVYDCINRPNLGVCSSYSFHNPCHFRLLVHSKTRYDCLHKFFIIECIKNYKAFMLYAWIFRQNIGVCSKYSYQNSCHFRFLVYSKTRCYWLHEFFERKCIQNNKPFMVYTWIDCPSLGVCSTY